MDKSLEKENNLKVKKNGDVAPKTTNPIAKFFKFNDLNTTFKKEIIGGISTFLAMVYILSVEPAILSGAQSITDSSIMMNESGIFLATVIVVFLATMVQGIWSRAPIALAPSMGLNAFFTFNVANAGLGFEGAMLCVILSSTLFTLIAITPVRAKIVNAMPHSLQLIIGVGVGFFIAYVGLDNMGLFDKSVTGLPVASMSILKENYPGIILGMIVLIGSIILFKKGFIAPVAIMMFGGLIIAIIFGNINFGNSTANATFEKSFGSTQFSKMNWDFASMFKGFASNIKSAYTQMGNSAIWKNPTLYIAIFVMTMLNFFDATATITSIGNQISKINDEKYMIPKSALIVDAASGIVGGGIGTSHVACFMESSVGVSQGAKSGFANIVTGSLFLLAIPLFPIFKMMPPCISGAATAFIGTVMVTSIVDIEWREPEFALSGFFAILIMITTFNIANGVAFAIIFYTIGLIANKKIKQVSPVIWCLDVLFILYFIAFAFIQ